MLSNQLCTPNNCDTDHKGIFEHLGSYCLGKVLKIHLIQISKHVFTPMYNMVIKIF